ncbi:MAG TPA: ribosome recycling factor [bacterium]|nr:ribosome recycling factor [bacterium]
MSEQTIPALKSNMEKSISSLSAQLAKISSGRAQPGLIEDIMVDYYGTQTPLKQIASITVPETRQLLIQPWDKAAVFAIDKAIQISNLGLTPQVEGQTIRINIPQMTEERRKDMKKIVDDYGEKARVALRAHRQDAIKDIKTEEKDKQISEDDSRRLQEQVQKMTESFNSRVDELVSAKEKEIMTV